MGILPIEKYNPERKAEFLLSTAITPQDYQRARKEVLKLGLDPDTIPHHRPSSAAAPRKRKTSDGNKRAS